MWGGKGGHCVTEERMEMECGGRERHCVTDELMEMECGGGWALCD